MTSILKTDEIQSQNGGAVVKMQTLKHPSASGNNLVLGSDGSTTITNGTLSAGSIGDNVVYQSAKYYLQLNALANGSWGATSEMMNNSGSTIPYFSAGVGDTTNIVAVNNHDYKLVKAGVYLIMFSATFYESSDATERYVFCQIRTNLSSPTSSEGGDVLAAASDNIANTSSNSDYGSPSCQVVHNFSANSLINFRIGGAGTPYFNNGYASIILIRPL